MLMGMKILHSSPKDAAIALSEIPVLPLVASHNIVLSVISPRKRAFLTAYVTKRSLTEPVGLYVSSFPYTRSLTLMRGVTVRMFSNRV